ncbi:HNH endonuclease [Granulicella arctica]|uniref:HNH endonuclease n=1 Tax=Granulicella arctica TaxID=940613 RepID=UPI0021E0419A|nr:HNH endonuclease [Granulicella arctica]
MPELSPEDRARALAILAQVRAEILAVAGEDRELSFQMKRYIAKRLEFDERGTPTQRKKLKEQMLKKQGGLCALCREKLPQRGAELDRFKAIDGYTVENTQLVCPACHRKAQRTRDVASQPI